MEDNTNIKGLILSGGAGTRLRPLTHTSAKQLVPVANKPVINYGIEALVEAGITEIGIIIAPNTGEEIKESVGNGSEFGAEVTYILQQQPKGLAHAVLTARDFIGNSDFVMYLGDNILRDGITDLVSYFINESKADSIILLTEVEDPSSYGIAELDGNNIKSLEEKPAEPKSNLALVGVYIFTNKIFAAANSLVPSKRGELEITEAIQTMIKDNLNVEYKIVDGWWKDTGSVEEMLQANRLVLDSAKRNIIGEIIDSKVDGNVIIEDGAKIVNSTIRGPAIIGKNSTIIDSYVGPNTAIDKNVLIKNSEIEYSIVLAGSSIENIQDRIEASLIGKKVKIYKKNRPPKTLSFVLGENSKVETL